MYNNFKNRVDRTAYLYKLTFLRLFTFLFSSLLIVESFSNYLYIESPYLIKVWEFTPQASNNLINWIFLSLGVLGILISTFFFEFIQSRKYLYIPLSVINVFLGILFTQIITIMTSGKEFIFYNKFILLHNHDKIVKTMDYLSNWIDSKKLLEIFSVDNLTFNKKLEAEKETINKNLIEKLDTMQQQITQLNKKVKDLTEEKFVPIVNNSISFFDQYQKTILIVIGVIVISGFIYILHRNKLQQNLNDQIDISISQNQKVVQDEKILINSINDSLNIKRNVIDNNVNKVKKTIETVADILTDQERIVTKLQLDLNEINQEISTIKDNLNTNSVNKKLIEDQIKVLKDDLNTLESETIKLRNTDFEHLDKIVSQIIDTIRILSHNSEDVIILTEKLNEIESYITYSNELSINISLFILFLSFFLFRFIIKRKTKQKKVLKNV